MPRLARSDHAMRRGLPVGPRISAAPDPQLVALPLIEQTIR